MYVIIANYTVPMSEVEKHVDGHRTWIKDNQAAKNFLLAGAQRPRTGGVIFAAAMERSKLDELFLSDPFYQHNVCKYDVIDVVPALADDRLAFLIEPH